MSSVGQALGGIVGGTIGFFLGGPAGALRGAQIGIMAGGLIDPPKGPTINGPRLDDLNVQTSTYGAFIPRAYRNVPIVGNVFWLQGDKLTEVQKTTTSGGKGGPETTTNTWAYYASFAIGLCEGPIDGVRRIWIGGQLWYDAGSDDISTIIASNEKADLFTLYLGTDTQDPDPLIQADKGIANTPAYRGLAYIVFDSLPLEKYNNSLAQTQIRVEVVKLGASTFTQETFDTGLSGSYYSGCFANGVLLVMPYGTSYRRSYDGQNFLTEPISSGNRTNAVWTGSHFICTRDAGSLVDVSRDGVTWGTATLPSSGEWRGLAYGNGVLVANRKSSANAAYSEDGGLTWVASSMPSSRDWQRIAFNGSIFCAIADTDDTFAISSDGKTWTEHNVGETNQWYGIAAKDGVFCAIAYTGSGGAKAAVSSDGINWTIGTVGTRSEYRAIVAGDKYFCTVTWGNKYAAFSQDGVTWSEIDIGTSGLWNVVGSIGDLFYATRFSSGSTVIALREQTTSETLPLSDVVESECLKSSLLGLSDLDTSELVEGVRGYRVSQLGAIRGSIDPLRAAWPFDVVQHGYQIKFKRRGSASVVTIPTSLLDARSAGSEPGVQITNAREMDLMLPRRVDVSYLDETREYDINKQMSPERTSTDAVGIRSVDLPIVFNAAEAAQKAETLLYLYWLERYEVALVLPPEYSELEPADVISITGEAADYELRLTNTNTLPDGRIECQARYNKAAVYTPVARGEDGQSVGATLGLDGPAIYSLLDIPLMRDDDDTAGFPVAMAGYLSGWPGGVLYRSDDGGQTWADLQAFTTGAVIGYATSTLAAHGGTVIDFSSTLAVRLYSGSLASVTQDQMFAGQNWFAYGAHGRWEIIAAATAVLQGDGSYILSDFLRGQRGTEWATGLHAANDRIVLLDAAKLAFISVNSSTIGATRDYRAITTGKALSSDASQSFAYQGINLECLSPVHFTGSRHPTTNDWTLRWTRRSRYDQWRDYVDAPLGEASESYEVDIFSDVTHTTLKRTLTSSTQTVNYSSANQVTDFGSNQSTLYVKIYQLSAAVGRGYPLTATITR